MLTGLFLAVLALSFACLLVGSSHMSLADCLAAMAGKGSAAQTRNFWNIRKPG